MSYPSNSIASMDIAEIKYKKALKQISKLMAANRALRQNSDKNNIGLKDKIQELSLRYQDLEKQYQVSRKQKQSLSTYLDQIQKQRDDLQKQTVYLNQLLSQQGATLRKYQLEDDQRAIANLIRTYQQKQSLMNRNITQQQQLISRLKSHSQKQQNQLHLIQQQSRNLQDKYNRSQMQINRYRQLNQTLMSQNQRILMQHSYKQDNLTEKEKQLEILAKQFRVQIGLFKMKDNNGDNGVEDGDEYTSGKLNTKIRENMEQLLAQKNRIAMEYTKLKQAYDEMQEKCNQSYDIEQKLKMANIKVERAYEQVNMLKSKVVVLQAKQFLQQAGEDDYGQKQFQERLAMLISQSDPINVLRNGDDSSHFKIMKSFLVDLQDKIYRINIERTSTLKKYKSVKTRFVKNVKQLNYYEEQNKLLKGKIEGYQRLTQKLQFQLQRALSTHDEEITRMSVTSNNILTKKTEDYKATISVLNSQIEIGQQKLDKVQKNLKQQNNTLKLELQTLRIKYKEFSEKSGKDGDFIQLYKKKNQQLQTQMKKIQEQMSQLNENSSRWQRLFREQKTKGEGLISQKQQLSTQNRQLFDQLDHKTNNFNDSLKSKQAQSQNQIKRLKSQISHLKDQLQYTSRQLQKIQRDLDDRRSIQQSQIDQIKQNSTRNVQLQQKNAEYKRRINNLEDENQTLKLKGKKYAQNHSKTTKLQQQLLLKNDKINDITRQKLTLQNDLQNVKDNLQQQKKQNQILKKDISELRLKAMDSSHESRRQFDSKLLEGKKNIQSLNQQISDMSSQIREQKSKNMRLSNQLLNLRAQKNRIQETMQQSYKKDFSTQSQIGTLKLQISRMANQNEKISHQMKNKQFTENKLNEEIQTLQHKIFALNQEVSTLKMKIQTAEDSKNDIARDLNSMKFNISAIQNYANKIKAQSNLKWEEETFLNSCTQIINKIKKMARSYGIVYQNTSPRASVTPSVTQSSNIGNIGGNSAYDYYKSYARGGADSSIVSDHRQASESSSKKPFESKTHKIDYISNVNVGSNKLYYAAGSKNTQQDTINPTYNYFDSRSANKYDSFA